MRRCARSPTSASSALLSLALGFLASVRPFLGPLALALRRRCGHLAPGPRRMEIVRDRGALVVQDAALLDAGDDVSGDGHPAAAHGHVAVDDELPRLAGWEREALEEGQGLEPSGEDRLHVEAQHVVQARALE